jgi:antitoxin VapB
MALNIKDHATLRLLDEVAQLAGENKTQAVRSALEEQRRRLRRGAGTAKARQAVLATLLETEIWPQMPAAELGHPIGRAEREAILGYGPEGV